MLLIELLIIRMFIFYRVKDDSTHVIEIVYVAFW